MSAEVILQASKPGTRWRQLCRQNLAKHLGRRGSKSFKEHLWSLSVMLCVELTRRVNISLEGPQPELNSRIMSLSGPAPPDDGDERGGGNSCPLARLQELRRNITALDSSSGKSARHHRNPTNVLHCVDAKVDKLLATNIRLRARMQRLSMHVRTMRRTMRFITNISRRRR